ncbi:hypothetical protein [Caenispirillum bisanense]|uniref:Uncharacterized protein n=1 Tax=Caenispirillum bisanense TaxID=414052 RepID=A0A286GQU9_9PROT|nr:hypothetical protein [Caenispirillum bisanense]SOD97556.1 hypothetical protein SAMN05421508_1075 [Caenispirillum bisanense]
MKALKALVAVMGILIVLGLVLLGWGIYTKMQKPGTVSTAAGPVVEAPLAGTAPAAPAAAPQPPAATFGTVTLAEPPSTEIEAVGVAEGRILLRLGGGGKPDRVVVLRAADGARLGTIELTVQP